MTAPCAAAWWIPPSKATPRTGNTSPPAPWRPTRPTTRSPGTAVYHLCVGGHIIQVGEYDLEGPLRDLVTVVLAIGNKMLAAPSSHPD